METIVCDIDGVLACNKARLAALDRSDPDWDAFHVGMESDPVLAAGATLLRLLGREHYIVLVSNRPSTYEGVTKDWLLEKGIEWDEMCLREPGTDYHQHKIDVVGNLISSGHRVALVIDDDPQHIANLTSTYRVPGLYVHSGYFDQGYIALDVYNNVGKK